MWSLGSAQKLLLSWLTSWCTVYVLDLIPEDKPPLTSDPSYSFLSTGNCAGSVHNRLRSRCFLLALSCPAFLEISVLDAQYTFLEPHSEACAGWSGQCSVWKVYQVYLLTLISSNSVVSSQLSAKRLHILQWKQNQLIKWRKCQPRFTTNSIITDVT